VTALADIVSYLDAELRSSEIPDYDGAHNGLQLANSGQVARVAAAVDYSANSVAAALRERADLLVVHHGMFWRGAQPIVGVAYDRLRSAMAGGLAIYASHIPLDLHPTLGNNALLAQELQLNADAPFGEFRGVQIGVMGSCDLVTDDVAARVRRYSAQFATALASTPYPAGRRTRRWAIITGAGASSSTIAEARARGVDTLIVGEGTHHTAVEAMELGLVIMYGGHYATETPGVRAVTTRLASRFGVTSVFVDVPTGL
jgi:dinuclear metal center YbgI/SA1388 family protein